MAQQGDSENFSHPFLLGLTGSLAGRKLAIEGKRVILGRDVTQCDIVLEQAVISKRHAAFETDEEGTVTVVDLSSKQTTFVNGAPVTSCKLKDGDRLGFGFSGVVAFTYCASEDTAAFTPVTVDAEVPTAPQKQSHPSSLSAGPREPRDATVDHAATEYATTNLTVLKQVVRIGRAPDNDVILDAPGVSRYHAVLTYNQDTQPLISDMKSTNGTFVNGNPLTEPRLVAPGDFVSLGGFVLRIAGSNIQSHNLGESRITAWHLTKEVGDKVILKDISLSIYPREFVGLMGTSGCGKSTLMDALNGLRPGTSGTVFVNDMDLYRNFDALRRSIGYVPQQDILHDVLTVERTLYFVAKIRLPKAASADNLRRIVDEVIETVALKGQRHTQFRQLSGGERKRLSLGFELITKPSFIFLDEPTSPLDPQAT
jgi:ABC-type lipoprotein export system ATPase subunit/pSer/pThr/pTyr-binding forkhead associated (FHA) protein